ncbi:hypothetical protein O0S10_05835 [Methanocorpusculum sp. MG]|uniref:Uncharacterized protein n=1 Tax=Methanocorpusculum petauri TaxID=3002863 RepID=A0ABT4IG98_9EURY|nr:hypothetical protein [Methanocorpusculum petauri]
MSRLVFRPLSIWFVLVRVACGGDGVCCGSVVLAGGLCGGGRGRLTGFF